MVAARSVQPVRRHCTACVSSPAKQDGWRAIGGPPTHSHSATGPAQAGQAGGLSQATFMTRWWVLARARVLVRVWVAVARGGDFTQVAPKPTSQPSVHEAPWVRFEMFAGQLPQTPLVGGATPLQLRKMHESSSCRRHGGKVSDRRAAPGATGSSSSASRSTGRHMQVKRAQSLRTAPALAFQFRARRCVQPSGWHLVRTSITVSRHVGWPPTGP